MAVSIHAPLRREERPFALTAYCHTDEFQSTPPSGERSDRFVHSTSDAKIVSIHAPLRREERPLDRSLWHLR